MMWRNWSDFLAMDGYGLFGWGAMGVCLLACLIEPLLLTLKRRALLTEMREQRAVETGQSGL